MLSSESQQALRGRAGGHGLGQREQLLAGEVSKEPVAGDAALGQREELHAIRGSSFCERFDLGKVRGFVACSVLKLYGGSPERAGQAEISQMIDRRQRRFTMLMILPRLDISTTGFLRPADVKACGKPHRNGPTARWPISTGRLSKIIMDISVGSHHTLRVVALMTIPMRGAFDTSRAYGTMAGRRLRCERLAQRDRLGRVRGPGDDELRPICD